MLSVLKIVIVSKINLEIQGQMGEIQIDPSQYIKSTEWEIVGKDCVLNEAKYDCCPEIYQVGFSVFQIMSQKLNVKEVDFSI